MYHHHHLEHLAEYDNPVVSSSQFSGLSFFSIYRLACALEVCFLVEKVRCSEEKNGSLGDPLEQLSSLKH